MSDDTLEKRVTKLEKDMADHKKSAEFASTMVRKIVDVLLKQFGVKLGVVLVALMGTTAFGVETLWDTISSQQSGTATARVIVASMGSAATMHVDRVVCADIYASAYNITTTNAYYTGTMKVDGAVTLEKSLSIESTDNKVTNSVGTNGVVTLMGNLAAGGTLTVTGVSTLTGAAAINATAGNTMKQMAHTSTDSVTTNTFGTNGTVTIMGATTMASSLGVTGTTTLGAVNASGNVIANGGVVRAVSTDNVRTNEFGTNGLIRLVGIPTSAGASGYLWASNGVLVIQP